MLGGSPDPPEILGEDARKKGVQGGGQDPPNGGPREPSKWGGVGCAQGAWREKARKWGGPLFADETLEGKKYIYMYINKI